jgi:general secretion pathway protein D
VMRDAESANKLSLDRYDLIRSSQKDAQPSPHLLLPINDAPIVPPLRVQPTPPPLSAPPPASGPKPN